MGGDFFLNFWKGGDFVNEFGKPCSREWKNYEKGKLMILSTKNTKCNNILNIVCCKTKFRSEDLLIYKTFEKNILKEYWNYIKVI